MANCILCSTELKFMNTPTFGMGNLQTGGVVCMNCFKKINKVNPKVALKLKNHSLDEIRDLLLEKVALEIPKPSRLDEIKYPVKDKVTSEVQETSRLDEIKENIKGLKLDGISNFFGRREINELPKILAPNEVIDNLAQGAYNKGQGILVSTNRRLLFVDKGFLYGLKVEDFPLDKITSIQYETGLVTGEIRIHTAGNIAKIDNVFKASAKSFAEFVRNKLAQPKETLNTTVAAKPDVLDQLEKLARLKENGILSDDEFNEQKKKMLERL